MVLFPVDRSNIEDNHVLRFLLFAFWICLIAAVPFWNGWVEHFGYQPLFFFCGPEGEGAVFLCISSVLCRIWGCLTHWLYFLAPCIHFVNALHELNKLHLENDRLCFSCLHSHRVVNLKLLKGCSGRELMWLNYTLGGKNHQQQLLWRGVIFSPGRTLVIYSQQHA